MAEVVKGDEVKCHIVLYNSHDGSLAVGISFTPIRVVCANTLGFLVSSNRRKKTQSFDEGAVSDDQKFIRLRHTRNLHSNLEIVQRAIDFSAQQFDMNIEMFKRMAQVKVNDAQFKQYLTNVFKEDLVSSNGKEKEVTELRNYEQLRSNFESGIGSDIPGVRGTVWGLFNTITEFTTRQRGNGDDIEAARNRLNSLWFGDSAKLNERAKSEALALCK